MKAMLMKVLRFLKLEVLLLGLIEKLARGLVKKLSALETVAKNALEQARKLREQKHECSHKKGERHYMQIVAFRPLFLVFFDCANGASVFASAAIYTFV